MTLDAEKQFTEQWGECEGDERDRDGADAEPHDEGVPLPTPELTCESDGVGAGRFEKRFGREWHWLGVKEEASEADQRDHEDKLERIDDVVSYLRGGYVETKEKGHCKAENSRAADDGIDADEETDGDAPGEFLWGRSETEEREDGQGDAPVEPVVMNGPGSWFDTCGDGFVLIHS